MTRPVFLILACGLAAFGGSAMAKMPDAATIAAIQAQRQASLEAAEAQEAALRHKAEAGDVDSEYLLGSHLVGQGAYVDLKPDPPEGLKWLDKAIADGSGDAMVEMGYMYRDGKLKPKDKLQAVAWFRKAADLGNRNGEFLTCKAYTADADIATDWTFALPYCEAAAKAVFPRQTGLYDVRMFSPYGRLNQGDLYFQLGRAFAEGTPLPRDPDRAVANLSAAVKAGSDPAVEYLAFVYFKGDLVAQDYGQSLALFQADYLNGSATGLYMLARHYENGWGTAANPRQAQRDYLAAAMAGVPEAQAWLKAHPDVTQAAFARDIIDARALPANSLVLGTSADGKTAYDYYPDDAKWNLEQGGATVDCDVTPEGRFEYCLVVADSNPKFKLGGAAARTMTDLGQLNLPKEALAKLIGKTVRKTVAWRVEYETGKY